MLLSQIALNTKEPAVNSGAIILQVIQRDINLTRLFTLIMQVTMKKVQRLLMALFVTISILPDVHLTVFAQVWVHTTNQVSTELRMLPFRDVLSVTLPTVQPLMLIHLTILR